MIVEDKTDNGRLDTDHETTLPICRRRKTAYSVALALLMICGLLAALAPGVTAAVDLLYFRATAGSDKIMVEWETATEQDVSGFNLYRSEVSGVQGQQIGDYVSGCWIWYRRR